MAKKSTKSSDAEVMSAPAQPAIAENQAAIVELQAALRFVVGLLSSEQEAAFYATFPSLKLE